MKRAKTSATYQAKIEGLWWLWNRAPHQRESLWPQVCQALARLSVNCSCLRTWSMWCLWNLLHLLGKPATVFAICPGSLTFCETPSSEALKATGWTYRGLLCYSSPDTGSALRQYRRCFSLKCFCCSLRLFKWPSLLVSWKWLLCNKLYLFARSQLILKQCQRNITSKYYN